MDMIIDFDNKGQSKNCEWLFENKKKKQLLNINNYDVMWTKTGVRGWMHWIAIKR